MLELGAGVGLVSILLAAIGSKALCTDIGREVLLNCLRNKHENQHLFADRVDALDVRWLDWLDPPMSLLNQFALEASAEASKASVQADCEELTWTDADSARFHGHMSIIIAADVVYVP